MNKSSNLESEQKYGVIGIDEVGRGPLAGPVTVCAVYLKDVKSAKHEYFNDSIRDSKRLSLVLRNKIYLMIRKNRKLKYIDFEVSSRGAKHVDKYGINSSIHSCIVSCLNMLKKRGVDVNRVKINLDGGLKIKIDGLNQNSYIKGDENYTEIALSSIIAKVTRDKYMRKIAKEYNMYDFENNVGYGTKKHINAIKKFGVTKYHRLSYLSHILQG